MGRFQAKPLELNPYEVLGVRIDAPLQQIRERFKRQVLEAHPDKNPHRPDWSERRIRELIVAFEMVSDSQRRAEVDALLGKRRPVAKRYEQPFFYRKKDPEARALLILHHLVKRRPELALEVLSEMEKRLGPTFLADNLESPDYLDCLFLLGEYYEEARRFSLSAEHYRAIYLHQKGVRFPRHYLDEVLRRLKDLYLRKIPRHGSIEEALDGLTHVESLLLTKSEKLLRLRKLAELLVDSGRLDAARDAVEVARELDPQVRGFDKVEKALQTVAP